MATYYCGYNDSGTLGSDANAGTSFGARVATLAKLETLLSAGDIGVVTAPSAYPITLASSFQPTASGTNNTPIYMTGGNATDGSIDGSIAYVDANSAAAHCIHMNAATQWRFFGNMNLTGATSHGFHGDNANWIATLFNVTAESNGGDGIHLYETNQYQRAIVNCNAYDNSNYGIYTRGCPIINCQVDNNTADGIRVQNLNMGAAIVGCRATNNGDEGIYIDVASGSSSNRPVTIDHCTIADNTNNGIQFDDNEGGQLYVVRNCILSGNGAYGISVAVSSIVANLYRNHYHSNTSGNYENVDPLSGIVEGATSGDPLYVNSAGEDYRPRIASPVLRRDTNGQVVDYAGAYMPHVPQLRRKMVRL